jgi:uncharacterized protein YraI
MSQSDPSEFEAAYSPQPEPQLQVVVHAGPLAGKGYPIRGEAITFGRDPDNAISWDDSQVSRHHARLIRRQKQLVIQDLGSTNGTLVNGKPIESEHVLQPADIISIGASVFGVKGFTAPRTMEMTQVSPQRLAQPPAMAAAAAQQQRAAAAAQPVPVQTGSSKYSLVALGGILALIVAIIFAVALAAYFYVRDTDSPVTQVPAAVITAPANGSQVQLNLPVTVQATASDPTGVVKIELWVNGVKTAEALSPAPQGQPTFTVSLQWVPTIVGSHTLELRAYNVRGGVSAPAAVLVNAIASAATENSTPSPTSTSEAPTATIPTGPLLTIFTDLNVRSGPDTSYEFVGLLLADRTADIIGRDEARQWWQIRFEPAPGGIGWVTADPAYSTAINVESLPIVQAPPTPTGTPTQTPSATPLLPTATPSETAVPATPTPTSTATPTATATQAGSKNEFDVSPTRVQGGECVNVTWSVIEVREVYFQGQGVPGVGGRQECPKETTIYRLRIVNLDSTEEVIDRTVEVVNPITSAGAIKVDPGQTIDFDAGVIPGDDFRWNVSGGTRRFEVLDGVSLSPQGQLISLAELTLATCSAATYGVYTSIDGSDVIADPTNALTAGRAACYRTNQGRLGKLRFPEYSTQSLTVEWLTWQ